MKKVGKRVITTVLALTLLMSVLAVATSAATSGTVKHYSVYVNLGDSIASGYGLPNDQTPKTIVPNSYGARLAYAVQADYYYAYAQRGFRTTEIRMLLDNNYNGDAITDSEEMKSATAGYTTSASLKKQRAGYQNAVKKADLITLDVGFNDIWIPLEHFVNQVTGNTLMAAVTLPVLTAQTVWEWSAQFMINYAKIIDQITALNPDCTIILVGSYNPCDTWSLNGSGVGYGKLIGPVYDAMNVYKKLIASTHANCTYVDVSGVDVGTKQLDLSQGGFEPHPTQKGHQYMANQILAALPTGS
ncbi:MAG TPA: SGNH/GDSL hydrolase family protein, partial [Clostridiales bacterium]|nr:SGNH/GDSL hydrolase family protein [Clostridiales bacterium]